MSSAAAARRSRTRSSRWSPRRSVDPSIRSPTRSCARRSRPARPVVPEATDFLRQHRGRDRRPVVGSAGFSSVARATSMPTGSTCRRPRRGRRRARGGRQDAGVRGRRSAGQVAAVIAIADTPKAGSAAAVAELHRLGIDVTMLTGDNRRTAEAIARSVGIDGVARRRPPDGKAAAVDGAPGRRQGGRDGRRRGQRRPRPGRRPTSASRWARGQMLRWSRQG